MVPSSEIAKPNDPTESVPTCSGDCALSEKVEVADWKLYTNTPAPLESDADVTNVVPSVVIASYVSSASQSLAMGIQITRATTYCASKQTVSDCRGVRV